MSRLARAVIPQVPHHITQRGNRRQRTFFRSSDYHAYKGLLAEFCRQHEVRVWAYCLMPNHAHLILEPKTHMGLARAVGETHRRYTRMINQRKDWTGYLWQGRFASFPLDEVHLINAVRYVLLNPVRAGISARAEQWPHSSARAHLRGLGDGLVDPEPLARRISNWTSILLPENAIADVELLRLHQRTGRPLGSETFILGLEEIIGRRLRRRKPGPQPRTQL